MAHVVIAEFETAAGCTEEFLARMVEHAALSRAEPGCRTFDVCRDPADPARVLLYEVYDDDAAYLAHRASAHYARFRTWAPPLVVTHSGELLVSRRVLARVAPAGP